MINLVALVFIENAFFSWLFDIAPKAAVAGAVMWLLLRWAVKYGRFEARIEAKFEAIEIRFVAIESRLDSLEVRMDSVESRLTLIETRLGKVEGQLEIVIDLLKNKK